jgi:hypothetical protein
LCTAVKLKVGLALPDGMGHPVSCIVRFCGCVVADAVEKLCIGWLAAKAECLKTDKGVRS